MDKTRDPQNNTEGKIINNNNCIQIHDKKIVFNLICLESVFNLICLECIPFSRSISVETTRTR